MSEPLFLGCSSPETKIGGKSEWIGGATDIGNKTVHFKTETLLLARFSTCSSPLYIKSTNQTKNTTLFHDRSPMRGLTLRRRPNHSEVLNCFSFCVSRAISRICTEHYLLILALHRQIPDSEFKHCSVRPSHNPNAKQIPTPKTRLATQMATAHRHIPPCIKA